MGASMCCSSRTRGAPPPAEFCGCWFRDARSLEKKLGTAEVRRDFGLEVPDDDFIYAWAIVDSNTRMLEWRKVSAFNTAQYSGRMEEWTSQQWKASEAFGACVWKLGALEYTECKGVKLLTAFTMEGHRLERALTLDVADGRRLTLLISEARSLRGLGDLTDQCLMAIKSDHENVLEKTGQSQLVKERELPPVSRTRKDTPPEPDDEPAPKNSSGSGN
mmetsp:Transcript_5529/g.9927  ORF Transcript_5529/g.9927 Transcript_5529/m.9927 type:complete len:218 (-) Transcript_5529:63-716(-)